MDEILVYLALWASSFVNVFLLGSQSKNVQHSRYLAAALTSFGITVAQFFFVRMSVAGNPALFIAVSGTAGAAGICSAIWLHDRIRRHRADKESA